MSQDESYISLDRPADLRKVDAVIVGAGFAGLYAIHRLRSLGLKVLCIEAAPDVGGTWFWNKYPGARCDVPSLEYSYSFSEELQQEWIWSERFASQPEILSYIRHVVERFGLRQDIIFSTRVTSAVFKEAGKSWTLATDTSLIVEASFFIAASGCLSSARTPDISGISNFLGPVFHSGQWPEKPVRFDDLRVGVIGTGSSGIQIIPEVARVARQVVVFQRTPNFSVPSRNRPLQKQEQASFKRQYMQTDLKRGIQTTACWGWVLRPGPRYRSTTLCARILMMHGGSMAVQSLRSLHIRTSLLIGPLMKL